jgi:DNA-binding response OmpR family regulator
MPLAELHHSKILVVEDDPAMRSALARLVRMCGYEAVTAQTVSEALCKLDCDPTHVFLDMNLPDGMGTTILWHIRANKMTSKVAVLSGTSDLTLLEEARTLLVDEIFTKPADVDKLIAWMAE